MNLLVETLLLTSKATTKKLLSDMPQRRTCCVVNVKLAAAVMLGFTVASCQSHILSDLPLPVTEDTGAGARPLLPEQGPLMGSLCF